MLTSKIYTFMVEFNKLMGGGGVLRSLLHSIILKRQVWV